MIANSKKELKVFEKVQDYQREKVTKSVDINKYNNVRNYKHFIIGPSEL